MREQVICWPSREEKKKIPHRFVITYELPNCIEIIDGTSVFQTEAPEWSGEDVNTWKGGSGINALVVCDDHCHVLHYYIRWPGSTHDNHSWRNCYLDLNEVDFLEHLEFIIGDSAFNPSKRMIVPNRESAGQSCLNAENEFNRNLSSARIKFEHCIRLIKNHFPCLHELNVRIWKAYDVKHVVNIFTVCIILHNLPLSEPDILEEWYEQCEEDIGIEVEGDYLYGREVCLDDENRKSR